MPTEMVTKRGAEHAKLTAVRTAVTTKDPALPTTKKRETTARAVVMTTVGATVMTWQEPHQ